MSEIQIDIPADLIQLLRGARSVAVLTGAGVSAESGIPTFREDRTGLWSRFKPEELATLAAFQENPRLVWEWYRWRRGLIQAAQPNPAHAALAAMEAWFPDFTLITQNIDGLHQIAGSQKIVELHGNIHRVRCTDEATTYTQWDDTGDPPPQCPSCGALLRPDVIWFGEALPRAALEASILASRNCQVFLSIGTSGMVEPASSLAYEALRSGAVCIEINPNATPLTVYARYYFGEPAGVVLPALVRTTWPDRATAINPG